jgi:putative oxidoreductase
MNAYVVELQTLSIGLLLVRLVVGLAMAAHGTQKLWGRLGGYGLNKTGEFFVNLGYRPGRTFAALASVGEITSGLLVALGSFGAAGPALMISVMIAAMITVHWERGLFASTNGVELPLLYIAAALVITLAGYGQYSLDARFGIAVFWTPTVTWVALGMGVLGGLANVAIRRSWTTPAGS